MEGFHALDQMEGFHFNHFDVHRTIGLPLLHLSMMERHHQHDPVSLPETDDEEEEEGEEEEWSGLAPSLEGRVFDIRNNNPNMNHLHIGSSIDPRAWKQLGRWLQRSKHLGYVCLVSCNLKRGAMVDLCKGLQHNKSIKEFDLSDNKMKKEDIRSLSPFISNSPSLHTLNIDGCLGKAGIKLLSEALMGRSQSIENISLDRNCIEGRHRDDFDGFVDALIHNKELRRLSLMFNQIGKHGCKSLARLLTSPHSQLKSLILRHNCINDECAVILAESLSNNTSLNNVDLDRNDSVSEKGLMAFLKVVSGTPKGVINLNLRRKSSTAFSSSYEGSPIGKKIRMNEPLRRLAQELCEIHNCASDVSRVRFSQGWKQLDLAETPYFYGLEEGGEIDVVIIDESEERAAADIAPVTADDEMDIDEGDVGGDHSNSISVTIQSNHSLTSVGYETARSRGFVHGLLLREFLHANKRADKNSTARVKVFRVHIENSLSVEDFSEMDIVIPRVLAWIGAGLNEDDKDTWTYLSDPPSDIARMNAMYHVIRSMPMLCGY